MYYVTNIFGSIISEVRVNDSSVLVCGDVSASAIEMSKAQAEALAAYLNTISVVQHYAVDEDELEEGE